MFQNAINSDEPLSLNQPPGAAERISALIGTWKGHFRVFGSDGSLVRSVELEQVFHWNGTDLIGKLVERDPTGAVTESSARIRQAEGRLVCEITSREGMTVTHFGRWESPNLFWYRRDPQTGDSECIKECITDGKRRLMLVDGFGVYGGVPYLFEGRYREQILG